MLLHEGLCSKSASGVSGVVRLLLDSECDMDEGLGVIEGVIEYPLAEEKLPREDPTEALDGDKLLSLGGKEVAAWHCC